MEKGEIVHALFVECLTCGNSLSAYTHSWYLFVKQLRQHDWHEVGGKWQCPDCAAFGPGE